MGCWLWWRFSVGKIIREMFGVEYGKGKTKNGGASVLLRPAVPVVVAAWTVLFQYICYTKFIVCLSYFIWNRITAFVTSVPVTPDEEVPVLINESYSLGSLDLWSLYITSPTTYRPIKPQIHTSLIYSPRSLWMRQGPDSTPYTSTSPPGFSRAISKSRPPQPTHQCQPSYMYIFETSCARAMNVLRDIAHLTSSSCLGKKAG